MILLFKKYVTTLKYSRKKELVNLHKNFKGKPIKFYVV